MKRFEGGSRLESLVSALTEPLLHSLPSVTLSPRGERDAGGVAAGCGQAIVLEVWALARKGPSSLHS